MDSTTLKYNTQVIFGDIKRKLPLLGVRGKILSHYVPNKQV